MKRILVPTDFSECALPAIDFASNLARKTNGEIYLLHVIEGATDVDTTSSIGAGGWASASDTLTVPYMIERLKLIKRKMKTLIKETKLYGLNVFDEIETGEPYHKINDAAEKYNADIIIMGTHGASGWKELIAGSTAEKVVQHSNRPVLCIKNNFTVNPSRIVFASDFSVEAGKIFRQVNSFASIFNSSVHLLNVADEDIGESERRIRYFLEKYHADYSYTVYPDDNTEKGILNFAQDTNADLIAIGTHGRKGLSRFFNPSVSERLINHSFLPVLTVRA
jgi:nucleotide-binding universal stress UspA family protein